MSVWCQRRKEGLLHGCVFAAIGCQATRVNHLPTVLGTVLAIVLEGCLANGQNVSLVCTILCLKLTWMPENIESMKKTPGRFFETVLN